MHGGLVTAIPNTIWPRNEGSKDILDSYALAQAKVWLSGAQMRPAGGQRTSSSLNGCCWSEDAGMLHMSQE